MFSGKSYGFLAKPVEIEVRRKRSKREFDLSAVRRSARLKVKKKFHDE